MAKTWKIQSEIQSNLLKNLSISPECSFYKKNVKELEYIFGVSLETQFKAVNNSHNTRLY